MRRAGLLSGMLVLTVFAALYIWIAPGPADRLGLAMLLAIPASLWLVASWLLVTHWRHGGPSTVDAPEQVLAAAVATLPEPRRRWGEAMLGELAQVRGRAARWRFALSCACRPSGPPSWPSRTRADRAPPRTRRAPWRRVADGTAGGNGEPRPRNVLDVKATDDRCGEGRSRSAILTGGHGDHAECVWLPD